MKEVHWPQKEIADGLFMTSVLQACGIVNANLQLHQPAIHMSIVVLACMYYVTATMHNAAAS